MTTTTMSAAPVRATACMSHGLLDGERACPRCGRQSYALDDEGDRATLLAFRKAAMKSRARSFGILGAVLGNLAETAVTFADAGVLDVSLFKGWAVAGVAVGVLVAWFARHPAHHRLDRALDP